jgi:hypothetical protein
MTADNQNSLNATDELLAQAEEMIWSLLDDNLPEADVPRLEKMFKDNGNVRNRYLECVQLHADLLGHFGRAAKSGIPELPASSDSPVLGSLGDAVPGVEAGPPVTD